MSCADPTVSINGAELVSSQNAVDSGRFELPPLACYVNMMYYPGLKHQTVPTTTMPGDSPSSILENTLFVV